MNFFGVDLSHGSRRNPFDSTWHYSRGSNSHGVGGANLQGLQNKTAKRRFKVSDDLHSCRINTVVNLWDCRIRCVYHRHEFGRIDPNDNCIHHEKTIR